MKTEKLTLAIENLRKTAIKCKAYTLGEIKKKENPLSTVDISEIKLSPELSFFYQNYDCDLIATNSNIALTPLSNLLKRQSGFATYSTDGSKTEIPNPNWTNGWIVFADMNDDPIVANMNITDTPILAAIEGANYIQIAPSLSVFFQILTTLLISSQFHKENEPDADEDFEEWISYNEEIVQPYFLQQVREILDEEHLENLKTFLYY
jgi:hypothetical protein